MPPSLTPRYTAGARVERREGIWHLSIPAGEANAYRLAQLDDYMGLRRSDFPWRPPLKLRLRARVSAEGIPGTWGFGLWNDPFGFALGFGGSPRRLPTLPQAIWFFHASPPNHLAFRDDIPAQGFFAGVTCSPRLPFPLPALGLPALPLLVLPPTARGIRHILSRIIRQEAIALPTPVKAWHTFTIHWLHEETRFLLDGRIVLKTSLSPPIPLGLVIWIDNQYARFTPEGKFGFGTLENPEPAWLEVADVEIRPS